MQQKEFLLRLPAELHDQVSSLANDQGISINDYIIGKLSPMYVAKKPLIEKIKEATMDRTLAEPFSTACLKKWVEEHAIVNDRSGNVYTDASINSLLANSTFDSDNKNLNRKVLERKKDADGVYKYWFRD